ncbi:MAG: twin-arginine translocase subunit TatC [Nitrospinales bacterium]
MKAVKFSDQIPISSHLKEFRDRLILVGVVVGLFFGVCFYFRDFFLTWLQEPLPAQFLDDLTFITPTEPFFTALKVSFMVSLFASMPVILFQVGAFVGPGLKIKEKKITALFVLTGTLFFVAGGAFCYFLVLPLGLKFLLLFGAHYWKMAVTIGSYVSFVVKLTLAFAFAFQMPLVLVFLTKLGLVDTIKMKSCRKWVFLGCFVLSAILTPPDIVTQIMLAFPLYGLYEFGIVASFLFEDPERRSEVLRNIREQKEARKAAAGKKSEDKGAHGTR